jgi:hypothetical protein
LPAPASANCHKLPVELIKPSRLKFKFNGILDLTPGPTASGSCHWQDGRVLLSNVTGKKTGGSRDTHGTHTGHAGAQRHTDHADEPHNHPNPPTTHIPHVSATTEAAADSTATGPEPTAPRADSFYRYCVPCVSQLPPVSFYRYISGSIGKALQAGPNTRFALVGSKLN